MKTKDLFGNPISEEKDIEVNIFADESMDRRCPYTSYNWHYTCLVIEILDNSLLPDILDERFRGHYDKNSPYYNKNNATLHWTDIATADEKHICKRWFEYILDPTKSGKKFFSYILGLNETLLNDEEFDKNDKFNSIYNRFFRSAIEYALKCIFAKRKVIIKNVYHEQGQQQSSEYFPWHPIEKLKKEESNFIFQTQTIQFLGKDHKQDEKVNILQLCDCFLGAVLNIIHGLENTNSKSSKTKMELMDLLVPLVIRMTKNPDNTNSHYKHSNRIMIRFFPQEKTEKNSLERKKHQFYTARTLKYVEDKSPQRTLPFKK